MQPFFQSALTLPLGQATTDKVVSVLTPIWYLGAGIALGLILLVAFVLLFKLLSSIATWEKLSHSPAGHAVAALLTAAIAVGVWFLIPLETRGNAALREPLLLAIALGLISSIAGWAIVFCSSKQAAANSFSTLGEGVSGYLGITALIVVFFGGAIWGIGEAVGRPLVARPLEAFASIPQLFSTGVQQLETTIEENADGASGPFVEVNIPIDGSTLKSVTLSSSASVTIADSEDSSKVRRVPFRMNAGEPVEWSRLTSQAQSPIPFTIGEPLFVQNREIVPATLTVVWVTDPTVPQAASLLITAVSVLLIGLAILLQQAVAPRASAVAHATLKNELAQPLFLVLMGLGALAIVLYVFLSFNTFGEDIKLLKECGIMTIMLLAAFQGIWSASSSVSEEIEGKTALTVLSKPIQRRSFIIGKFLGIFWVLLLMFVVLGTAELCAVSYKGIYDAREASIDMPTWEGCHAEMVSTVPGLAMAFMQAVVLTAISVALATRIPQLANLAICFSIYLVGNLSTVFVSSTQEAFDIVKFVAQLIATVIPILEHFQLQAAIDSGSPITMSLLSGNLLYCLLYVMLAMFLALLLFEDRDLA